MTGQWPMTQEEDCAGPFWSLKLFERDAVGRKDLVTSMGHLHILRNAWNGGGPLVTVRTGCHRSDGKMEEAPP